MISTKAMRCCCYHKGTYFQANHNANQLQQALKPVVVATTKVHIFKQITTTAMQFNSVYCCCCYHKGTYFQANHNIGYNGSPVMLLLLLPQRYIFSSKSQRGEFSLQNILCCCCYHKGTYFQANHNSWSLFIWMVISCCCYHKGTYFQANHNTAE